MSMYIHIPFCMQICTYCDFPKMLKNKKYIKDYLKKLENEIKERYKGEEITTLYIGGGTPTSLEIKDLQKLFKILSKINLKENAEVTIEANTDDLTEEKLKLLKSNINRLSIGIQTFDKKKLKELNRKVNTKNLKRAFKYIENINLDLMYGFKNQTLKDLEKDLDKIIKLNPKHISTYSLIIEPNTIFEIKKYKKIDEDKESKMYELIKEKLKASGFIQYEISNFSKKNYESKHNLTYWNNENYYGFGLGAAGYIENQRYENTRNLSKYLQGKYIKVSHKLDKNETLQNEFMLGLRKIKGIDKIKFKEKYGIKVTDIKEVKNLINQNLLIEKENNIFINSKFIYTSNEILLRLIDITLPNT